MGVVILLRQSVAGWIKSFFSLEAFSYILNAVATGYDLFLTGDRLFDVSEIWRVCFAIFVDKIRRDFKCIIQNAERYFIIFHLKVASDSWLFGLLCHWCFFLLLVWMFVRVRLCFASFKRYVFAPFCWLVV